MRRILNGYLRRWRVWRARASGVQIASDCRMVNYPNFGSEPYLISIGPHVLISGQVVFITHDGGTHVFRNRERFHGVIKYGRIVVHENCFIGFRATLLAGVSVGPNSVVAGCALVSRDVPPGVVVGGVPARHLMTVEEYAERSRERCPVYDQKLYRADKRSELLRLYPKPW